MILTITNLINARMPYPTQCLSVITLIRRDPEASKIRLIVEIIVSGRSNVSCRV